MLGSHQDEHSYLKVSIYSVYPTCQDFVKVQMIVFPTIKTVGFIFIFKIQIKLYKNYNIEVIFKMIKAPWEF